MTEARTRDGWPLALLPAGVFLGLLGPARAAASHLSMPDLPGLGDATISPPPLSLLTVGLVAALAIGVATRVAPPTARARRIALASTALPLAWSAWTSFCLETARSGVAAGIEAVAAAGTIHLWALLSSAALLAGLALTWALGARRSAAGSSDLEPLRWGRGAFAALLAAPFGFLILDTSTGIDVLSSWIRWGACGLVMIALPLAALRQTGTAGAPVVEMIAASFFFTLLAALGAQHEYVEALGADTLLRSNPYHAPDAYVAGLRAIASAVEPREQLGPICAVLPWLFLGDWTEPRRLRRLFPLAASGALAVMAAIGVSRDLDEAAACSTCAPSDEVERLSVRVLPRTVAWVRARRGELSPEEAAPPALRCASLAPFTPARSVVTPWWPHHERGHHRR